MKKYFRRLPVILTVVFLSQLPTALVGAGLPGPVAAEQDSIVTIYAYTADGSQSLGTGWFLSDSLIVTCYHVIDGGRRIEVMMSDHRMAKVREIVAADQEGDIAILAVAPQSNIKPLPLSSRQPQVGENVFALNTPHGLNASLGSENQSDLSPIAGINAVHAPVTAGVVSGFRQYGNVRFVQFTAPITRGSSGSAVVNERGEVVAVVQSMEGQGSYFGVDIGRVRRLLNAPEEPPPSLRPNPPDPRPANGKVVERAQGGTQQSGPRDGQPRPQPSHPENGKAYENK